jgi:hypothetical protein
VAGAGATVVLVVAGAAVVGGVVVATVVAGAALVAAPLLEVPWVPWAPAGSEAGVVCADAGRALRTRNRPARRAKDAAHLRGLTTSILGLVLIVRNAPPGLGCRREGRRHTSQGRGEVYHGPGGHFKAPLAL